MWISLNGDWNVTFPDGKTAQGQVPGCFDTLADRWDIAEPVVYEKTFFLDAPAAHAQLCFGAVSYACEVWLNGTLAGRHEGMWDAFRIDASSLLRSGENHLRVCVTKPGYAETDAYPLRQVLSGFIPDVLCTFGGLWDSVGLEIEDAFFITHHAMQGDGVGNWSFSMLVDAMEPGAHPGQFRFRRVLRRPGRRLRGLFRLSFLQRPAKHGAADGSLYAGLAQHAPLGVRGVLR